MILAPTKADQKARARRRLHGISMFVGRNGSAKSACMVYDTMPTLDAGRPALSTVRLLDWNNPRPCEGWQTTVTNWVEVETDEDVIFRPIYGREDCTASSHGRRSHLQAHPLYVPFSSWDQLLSWRFGDVLMDEVTGVADSNDNTGLPGPVRNFIAQMRREDVALRITGISWMRAAKQLREVVTAVTRCRTILPVPQSSDMSIEQRIWRPRRLAIWRTYAADTLPIDDITDNAWKEGTMIASARHWIPTSPAITAYNTYDKVLSVGTVTDAGTCAVCAGRRTRPECECEDYLARKPAKVAAPRAREGLSATQPRRARHGLPA